jgi:hypothetical protein
MIVLAAGSIVADGSVRDVFSREESLTRGMIVAPSAVRMGIANGFATLSAEEFIACMDI